ncbi:hypothetical protein KI387_017075, partial [Taxus chinensis]
MAKCNFFLAAFLFVFAVDLVFLSGSSLAQTTCTKSFTNNLFSSCQALNQLDANFAWTYDPAKGAISMAFTAAPDASDGWVSWGINPTGTSMGGTRSLIAFKQSNGTVALHTYNVTDANKSPAVALEPSAIDYTVDNMTAEYSNNKITIFARWTLLNNKTTVNHVWQTGSQVKGLVPQSHKFNSANLQSSGSIDLKTGVASVSQGAPRIVLKNRHGVLNVVGWSIMLPIGIIIARYLRCIESADPSWFYLHVFCQVSGFVLGVAGWATGLKLGSYSKGIVYSQHRNLGIAIFAICTVQMFALLVRPKKEHKIRRYWNIYHHTL